MTGVPWLVPSPRLGGISAETRRALGPLATLIDDPRVTDVFVLGGGRVYVDTGRGTFAAEGLHLSHAQALDIARALIESGGRHVDDAQPLVDVSLPGGLRVHVTLAPVATAGTEISLRVARHRAPELTSLEIEHSERFIPWVISAVEHRQTLLISGATGSGKTTLLGAAMAYATPVERLVVLEEVSELSLNHPHVVALECRQANLEGAGEITLTRLVRESLRMRPSRLIIGEIRGAEIADVLQAFHTGHPGGGATLHASSLEDVPARLEGLGALAGMTPRVLASQVIGAIHRVIHVDTSDGGPRRLSVGTPRLGPGGELTLEQEVVEV
jgi:pilus assembly protein CpaF